MTLRYSDTNQHDALYKVARAYPGGIEALAQRMGKTANVLYNKLRPGVDSHYPSFEEVSEIVELCAAAGVPNATLPIEAMCQRHSLVAFAFPALAHLSDADLTQSVCKAMQELGDVTGAIASALADDGGISLAELDGIEREIQQALGAIGALRERVRAQVNRPAAAQKVRP